ncbi:MAG: outer membrane protein [Microvirga sp.]
MKKLLLATTALLGFVGAATAADLAPRFVPAPPAFTWTGIYVGASVGAWFSDNNDDRGGPSTLSFPAGAGGPGSPFVAINSGGGGGPGVPFGAPVSPLAGVPLPTATVVGLGSVCAGCGNDRDTSLVFGVQVGYNYQFSPGSGFVVGVEADAQFLGEQGSSNRRGGVTGTTLVNPASVGTPPFGLFGSAPLVQLGPNTFTFFDPRAAQSENPDWFGTVRLRLGYAFDRWLVYGTGGLAYSVGGRVDPTVTVTTHLRPFATQNGFCRTNNNCDDTRLGWTLGAGFEYAITNNWSVKAEGLYVRIDRDNNNQATGSLPYAVASGPGFAPAGTSTLFYAPATAFNPRGSRNDDDFFILRAGVNYRFGTM